MNKRSLKLAVSWLLAIGLALFVFSSTQRLEAQDTVVDIWQGIYTDDQVTRGASTYQTECASCHREDLTGQDMSPSLVGIGFSFKWEGRNLQELYASMRYGMPQSAPGSLSNSAYVDLTAFLLSRNGYPAGNAELSADENELAKIEISRQP